MRAENSIAAIRAGIKAGADIIEFDVRTTKDGIPILSHDFHTVRTQKKLDFIKRHTLSELRKRFAGSEHPIVTLDDALREAFGKVMLNIEIKQHSAVAPTLEVLKKYIKKRSDWDTIIFSSFSVRALKAIRAAIPKAQLAMLHSLNPLAFIAHERKLRLSAVGFHRLRITKLAVEVAKRLDLFVYVYTVNRPQALPALEKLGVDGIVTDFPNKFADPPR